MAIAEVNPPNQRASKEFGLALAYPNNVALNSLLIAAGTVGDATTAVTSLTISDTITNSWTVLLGSNLSFNDQSKMFIAYTISSSAGANTVTLAPSSGSIQNWFIDEFSGVNTSTPLDVDGGSSQPASTSTPSMNITTATDNALIIGVMLEETVSFVSITAGTGYTEIGHINDTANSAMSPQAQFKVAGTAGTFAVNWTLGGAKTTNLYAASFKSAAGATPPTTAQTVPAFIMSMTAGGRIGRSLS